MAHQHTMLYEFILTFNSKYVTNHEILVIITNFYILHIFNDLYEVDPIEISEHNSVREMMALPARERILMIYLAYRTK